MFLRLAVLSIGVGCGSTSPPAVQARPAPVDAGAPLLPEQPPTCRTATKHAVALVPGDHVLLGLPTGSGLNEHCEATKWSLEMRTCVAAIAAWDELEACAQRLLTKQQLEWRSSDPTP